MAKTPAAKKTARASATGAAGRSPSPAKARKPAAKARKLPIDTDLIRAIANLLSETQVGEIEIKKGDLKVRVSRQGSTVAYHPAPVAVAAAPAPALPASSATEAPAAVKATDAASHPGAVKSPMVGTAYRKSSPDAKNFVEIGSKVKAGEKLLLIEAMKTFNDITAPVAGTVTAVLIDDAQPVEFGQTLFVIE